VFGLDTSQITDKGQFMENIYRNLPVRMLAAMLVTVAVIILSTFAAHPPAQNQSSVTLKSIRTDSTAVFYADQRPDCAWFVEAVYADNRPDCAWFVEAVLPTGDSKLANENLKSVAATL
jgi:hypothetical protein